MKFKNIRTGKVVEPKDYASLYVCKNNTDYVPYNEPFKTENKNEEVNSKKISNTKKGKIINEN